MVIIAVTLFASHHRPFVGRIHPQRNGDAESEFMSWRHHVRVNKLIKPPQGGAFIAPNPVCLGNDYSKYWFNASVPIR